MKKKMAMMCIAGVMAVSLCACGNKSTQTGSDAAQTTEQSSETAATQEIASEEETKVSERADYVALADLDVDEYVTLGEYKDMTVQAAKTEVTDEVIENYINGNMLTTYPITDRAVEDGDLVTIDYVGKKDGEAFSGGSAEGYQLKIGSNTFIDGFEEGLIGVMPGDTVDLDLTFPESYSRNQDLAGQAVVFTVTVQNILESTDYENVTPEQLELMGLEYKTKEALWDAARKSVEEEAENNYQTNINNAIMDQLVSDSQFTSVPQPLVDEEVQNYNEYMEAICVSFYGCDLETYVTTYYQMTMDEYNAQLTEMAQETVKQYLVIEAVARQEGIEITDEDINKKAEEEAKKKAEAEAKKKAEEEAKKKAAEELAAKAEEEARKKATEEAAKAEAEAKAKAEEARKILEAAKKAEEEALKAAEQADSIQIDLTQPAEEGKLPLAASYLEKYTKMEKSGKSLVDTFNAITVDQENRNVCMMGDHGFGLTSVGEDFARSFYDMGICKAKTIAKIKAQALNKVKLADAMSKLAGGCMVVENAGLIAPDKMTELMKLTAKDVNDVVVILTGATESINRLFGATGDAKDKFTHQINMEGISTQDMLAIAKGYFKQQGFKTDDSVEGTVKNLLMAMESGNIDRMLKACDEAMLKCDDREKAKGSSRKYLLSEDFK